MFHSITLPSKDSISSGKIITIINTYQSWVKIKAPTGSSIRLKNGDSYNTYSYAVLQDFDRAEFVWNGSVWSAHFMSPMEYVSVPW